MPIYTLRRFMRPREGVEGPIDDVTEIDALDPAGAIAAAQAHVAEPDGALLAVELRDANEQLVWSLRRGQTISQRPGDQA